MCRILFLYDQSGTYPDSRPFVSNIKRLERYLHCNNQTTLIFCMTTLSSDRSSELPFRP